jgi:hypothetical protein
MSTDSEENKVIEWMNQNVAPSVDFLNTIIEKETERIYVGTRDLLVATLVGVFIGVLTNVSASFLMNGNLVLGFSFLFLSLISALLSFYVWRFYLIKDLQGYVKRIFYEQGKLLKEKFKRDLDTLEERPLD